MKVTVHIDHARSPVKITAEDMSVIRKSVEEALSPEYVRDAESGIVGFLSDDDRLEVNVLLVSNQDIKALNSEYRGIDRVTDVLSFWSDFEPCEIERLRKAGEAVPIGDVVISTEKAGEQSQEFGHSFRRELAYLVVHGVLHLVGYDHQVEEQKCRMRQAEERILSGLGLTRTQQ